MKKLGVVGAVLAALLASPAMAADLPLKAPPVYAPAPAPTWTGCYIGGNAGFVKQDTDIFDPQASLDVGTSNAVSGAGGGQVGCDYQFNSWLIGAQGMFDGTALNQTDFYNDPPPDPYDPLGIKTNWFATVTGRVGYLPGPNLLAYIKGGAAWVSVHYSENCTDCVGGYFGGGGSATILGYDIGVGFEYAFFPNLTAFAEINYMGFPSTTTTLTYSDGTAPYSYTYTHDILAILVGMNWRFNHY